tara:strand:- start:8312 stop:8833 length:522 start_codon:yes stop_codon:yes gene_type:complete
MSLFYQLLKDSTNISHQKELDALFSSVINGGENDIELYKLTAVENKFPTGIAEKEKCIAYMGLSKIDGREDIRYVEFTHEIEGCDGIIEPFIERIKELITIKNLIIIPRSINHKTRDLWTKYLSKYFTDIKGGEKFITKHKIPNKYLHWNELTKTLPCDTDLLDEYIDTVMNN